MCKRAARRVGLLLLAMVMVKVVEGVIFAHLGAWIMVVCSSGCLRR